MDSKAGKITKRKTVGTSNCAEFKAMNRALTAKPGASFEDFDIATIEVQTPVFQEHGADNCTADDGGMQRVTD